MCCALKTKMHQYAHTVICLPSTNGNIINYHIDNPSKNPNEVNKQWMFFLRLCLCVWNYPRIEWKIFAWSNKIKSVPISEETKEHLHIHKKIWREDPYQWNERKRQVKWWIFQWLQTIESHAKYNYKLTEVIELTSEEFFSLKKRSKISILLLETTKSSVMVVSCTFFFSTRVRKLAMCKRPCNKALDKWTNGHWISIFICCQYKNIFFFSLLLPFNIFSLAFVCSSSPNHASNIQFHYDNIWHKYIWFNLMDAPNYNRLDEYFFLISIFLIECSWVCARERSRYKQANKQTNKWINFIALNEILCLTFIWFRLNNISQLQLWIFKPIHHSSKKTANKKKVKVNFACVTLKT